VGAHHSEVLLHHCKLLLTFGKCVSWLLFCNIFCLVVPMLERCKKKHQHIVYPFHVDRNLTPEEIQTIYKMTVSVDDSGICVYQFCDGVHLVCNEILVVMYDIHGMAF